MIDSDIEESIRYNLGAEGDIQTIISDNNSSNISIRIKIKTDLMACSLVSPCDQEKRV